MIIFSDLCISNIINYDPLTSPHRKSWNSKPGGVDEKPIVGGYSKYQDKEYSSPIYRTHMVWVFQSFLNSVARFGVAKRGEKASKYVHKNTVNPI